MKTQLVGPPPRSGGDTTNPSRPDGFEWVDVLIHAVPYFHGAAIGIIEGLARKGSFDTWRKLNDHVKATILAFIGGAAEFGEEYADDPQVKRAMCKLSGAATSHGVAYAIAAGIGGQSSELTTEKALKQAMQKDWAFDPKTGKKLGTEGLLAQFTRQDAQDAKQAVKQMVARRDVVDLPAEPVAGIPFGESARPWAPVSLR